MSTRPREAMRISSSGHDHATEATYPVWISVLGRLIVGGLAGACTVVGDGGHVEGAAATLRTVEDAGGSTGAGVRGVVLDRVHVAGMLGAGNVVGGIVQVLKRSVHL